MTTTDPAAHAERPVWPDPDDAVEVIDRTDEVGHEPIPDDEVLVDDDGPDDPPVDDEQRVALLVARTVVAFAAAAVVLVAVAFLLSLGAVWADADQTAADKLTMSAAVCAAYAIVAGGLSVLAGRVLR